LQIPPANVKQGPAALANKKLEKFDQIGADNIIKQSWVCIYRKKYKNNYFLLLKAADYYIFCILLQLYLKKYKVLVANSKKTPKACVSLPFLQS
jgi:hypothetical protein